MANFDIGLSGIRVAQQAIDIIGTNVANAGTEGYHRQDVKIVPREYSSAGSVVFGGAEIADVLRRMDGLIESEYSRIQPQLGQVSQELSVLQTLESALGTIDGGGLGESMSTFFASLREIANQPGSLPLQEQVVWSAEAMTNQFRQIGQFIQSVEDHLIEEAGAVTLQANGLIEEIATLNVQIRDAIRREGNANIMLDRRDQAANELSELVQTSIGRADADGMISITAFGSSIVTGTSSSSLETATLTNGDLGVALAGAGNHNATWRGGTLGGLLSLKNDLVPALKTQLDALVAQIASAMNDHHIQGIGQAGSFTDLVGTVTPAGAVGTWPTSVTDGDFYVRITNVETGTVVRRTVTVATTDTLSDVAAKIDGLTDADATAALSASVADKTLRIQVTDASKFRYDFLPTSMPEFGVPWTGGNTSTPTVTGHYSGAANQDYTITVVGGGEVGVDTGLNIEVRNGAAELVTTLNVGVGYAAGDMLSMDNGLSISFGTGNLVATDSFTIPALASTDETGLLAAAGINTFFSGDTAQLFSVRQDILADSRRLATSLDSAGTGNDNVFRMQTIAETSYSSLGSATPQDYFRIAVTQIGQNISLRAARAASLASVNQQLITQRDLVSGVDINEETAMLLVFQQQFQAAAKFIKSLSDMMNIMMDLL